MTTPRPRKLDSDISCRLAGAMIVLATFGASSGCGKHVYDSDGGADLARADGSRCPALCAADNDCSSAGASHCLLPCGGCVECLSTGDCASGKTCDTSIHSCVSNNVDAGGDGPRLSDNDGGDNDGGNANDAAFSCPLDRGACCVNDNDCVATGSDGGGDGGAHATSGHCDSTLHQCVECDQDNDCAAGKICTDNACVDGCTPAHACGGSLTCCLSQCVDASSDTQNCGACANQCNGGWSCCNGSCENPAASVMNCGGCGIVCASPNSLTQCVSRACVVTGCQTGYGDCNGVQLDGCEVDLTANVNNCGKCSQVCTIEHATSKCAGSACAIDTCIPPYGDCNGDPGDGCETNLGMNDPMNCGACGNQCMLPHTVAQCAANACKITTCDAGYADCDLSPANGCETDLQNSAANCSACGMPCVFANAEGNCSGGACSMGACNPGYADCDHDPTNGCEIDTNNDPKNCGGCGMNACATVAPPPACDTNLIRNFALPGVCSLAMCTYPSTATTCANGCYQASCVTQPMAAPTNGVAYQAGKSVSVSTTNGQTPSSDGVDIYIETTPRGTAKAVHLFYAVGNDFVNNGGTDILMTFWMDTGNDQWKGTIPAQPAGTHVWWYIRADGYAGTPFYYSNFGANFDYQSN